MSAETSPAQREAEKRVLDETTTDAKRAKLDSEASLERSLVSPPLENGAHSADASEDKAESEPPAPAEKAEPTEATDSREPGELAEPAATTAPAEADAVPAEPAAPAAPAEPAEPVASADQNDAPAESANPEVDHMEVDAKPAQASESAEGETKPKTEADGELTPLEKAKICAEKEKVVVPEGLDPVTPVVLPRHQLRYATSAIKAIKRLKDAAPFLSPVDPIKQGVPQYFDYIKDPMDLGTIEKKLMQNDYKSVRQLADDFDLVVSNCIVFNGEDSFISKMAISIAHSFNKHLSNMPGFDEQDPKNKRNSLASNTRQSTGPEPTATPAAAAIATPTASASGSSQKQMQAPGVPMLRRESAVDGRPKREIHPPKPRDLPYGEARPRNKKFAAELKFCGQVIRELMGRKHESIAYPFLAPVDPVAQGVPNYFEIIKEPMDLSTIQHKLTEGQYYNADEFEADVRLMFRNCYAFNPEDTPVNELGHRLESVFDKRWIEKPQPAPTPPPMLSSDDSDYDDEYEDLGLSNPAIQVLEDQMRMLREQVRRLKRDAVQEWRDKRGKKKGGARQSSTGVVRRQSQASSSFVSGGGGAGHGTASTGHSRKQSVAAAKDTTPQELDYPMMKDLSEKISLLPDNKMMRVVQIIQESMPQLKTSGQEEIDIEMDKLDPQTLRKLYDFVVRNRGEDAPRPAPTAPATSPGALPQKKKKSKPLTEDEQNRQIEEIQQKLRQFDQYEGGTPTSAEPPSLPADDSSSSSSEEDTMNVDDSDSSSEEE